MNDQRGSLTVLLGYVCLFGILACSFGVATPAIAAPMGQWIWTSPRPAANERAWFRKEFSLERAQHENVETARLIVTCDNHAIVYLNGKQAARNDEWASPSVVDVEKVLRPGKNVLAVEAWNDNGPAGLFVFVQIKLADGRMINVATDKTWRFTRQRRDGWQSSDHDAKPYQAAAVVAKLGEGSWGRVLASPSVSVLGSTIISNNAGGPVLLDEQFELPQGFHIYRAATRDLSGGSYAMAIDGQGRLLVGDGAAVRRLTDSDGDQVYDKAETIAEGLGGRGPQGILVRGDKLYAVGGDGLQLYSGYGSGGPLKHEGRLGKPFPTGGDHTAHMLVRGLDDWIYFITGDGARNSSNHVNVPGSPVVAVRGASVYRVDPTGKHWECIGSGGRNAPGLGMNFLGEFFSFDSDLEYTFALPNYVPTRLIHWATGAQDGWAWNEEGGLRGHFPDLQPPVLAVGRGTPTMGTFYEHTQLPPRYHDAFICCDYVWKGGGGNTPRATGRVVVFQLARDGAGYKAKMNVLVDGKADAKDERGHRIQLAAVDVAVAADGSLLISDHNQGVWRVFYDEQEKVEIPSLVPLRPKPASNQHKLLKQILSLPQPGSEYTRRLQDELFKSLDAADEAIRAAALDRKLSLRERLRAVRILAPAFESLPGGWLASLAKDDEAELRAQSAWLFGLRRDGAEIPQVLALLDDEDPLVRRRACEALVRLSANQDVIADAALPLVKRLSDADPGVRYAAMIALAHIPQENWVDDALAAGDPQTQIRAVLTARWLNRNFQSQWVTDVVGRLSREKMKKEDRLAFYRLASLYAGQIRNDEKLRQAVTSHVFADFPSPDDDVRWEQVRLAGQLQAGVTDGELLALLAREEQPVLRLLILDALWRLPLSQDQEASRRLVRWLVAAQGGELDDPSTKGVSFPGYIKAATHRLAQRAPDKFDEALDDVVPGSFLAEAVYQVTAASGQQGVSRVMERLGQLKEVRHKTQVVEALQQSKLSPQQVALLVRSLRTASDGRLLQRTNRLILQQELPLKEFGDPAQQQAVVDDLLQLTMQPSQTSSGNQMLSALTGAGVEDLAKKNSLTPDEQLAAVEYWLDWYRRRYGRPFLTKLPQRKATLSDEQIHQLLLADKGQGDVRRGRMVYLQARCFACHGGGGQPDQATTFGPTLTGVMRRLKVDEVADALVYPSKKVDDRFRTTAVVTTDGKVLSGFLTQQGDESVTLVTPEGQLHMVPRSRIDEVGPQKTSPMPEGLLRYLNAQEIRDLWAYLRES